jgi:hypothetical protein
MIVPVITPLRAKSRTSPFGIADSGLLEDFAGPRQDLFELGGQGERGARHGGRTSISDFFF